MFYFRNLKHSYKVSWASLKTMGFLLLIWLLFKVFRAVFLTLGFVSMSNNLGVSIQKITSYSISDLIIRQSIYTLFAIFFYLSILFVRKIFIICIFLLGFLFYHLYYLVVNFWATRSCFFLIFEILWLIIFVYLGHTVIQGLRLKDKNETRV